MAIIRRAQVERASKVTEKENPTPFEQRWRRRFVERGTQLDDDAGIAGWSRTGLLTRVRQFQTLWAEHPGAMGPEPWVDVGCGAGTYTRLLHEQGYSVLGLDYSSPSLQKARERSPADIAWAAADIKKIPLPDNFAQGVLCFGVMQALGDNREALQELARIVKPGGELWVDALNLRCLPTRLSEWRRKRSGKSPHLRYETADGFREAAGQVGLNVISVEWLPILPGRLSRFQGLLEARPVRAVLKRVPFLGAMLSHSFILRACRP
jgi:SAM-dependent methyltransferase